MNEENGPEEAFAFEVHRHEQSFLDFLIHCASRNDRNPGVDLDGAFDGLNVVKLHHWQNVDAGVAENLIGSFPCGNVVVETDVSVFGEFFQVDDLAFGEGMFRAGDENQLVFKKRDVFEFPVFGGIRHDAQIHDVVENVFVDEVGSAVFQMDIYRRVSAEESLHVWRELVQSHAVDGGHADVSADDLLHLLQFTVETLVKVEDFLCRLVETLSFVCQLELFLTSVYDEYLEVVLHGSQLLANRGLGDPVDFGSLRKAFALNEVGKYFEVLDVHYAFDKIL